MDAGLVEDLFSVLGAYRQEDNDGPIVPFGHGQVNRMFTAVIFQHEIYLGTGQSPSLHVRIQFLRHFRAVGAENILFAASSVSLLPISSHYPRI